LTFLTRNHAPHFILVKNGYDHQILQKKWAEIKINMLLRPIFTDIRSKKVKNHDIFDFHEFGHLDFSMVKIKSRPPKFKI